MLHDGPKKFGRFIKKGSTVMDKVALEDFHFSEINATPTIEQDNSRRTIVHARYHSDTELKSVKMPKKFEDDLMHPDNKRPVIFPIDFTSEWEREKKLRKDRKERSDDDDDFSYSESYDTKSAYDLTTQEIVDGNEEDQTVPSRSRPEDDQSEITRLHTPLKIAGPQIREFSQDSVDDRLGSHLSMGAVPQHQPAPAPTPAPAQPALNLEQAMNPQAPLNLSNEEFIPNAPQAGQNEHQISDPEQESAEAYKQRLMREKVDQDKLKEIYEEAKAQGFQDGFRAGEEKGELQVRQNARVLFDRVQSLVESFMDLKSTVLNNVQENFYMISQAVAESLLKREFAIRPDAFAAVVRKAIDDAVAPNQFKIKVHPSMAERLQSIADKEFLTHIVKDPSVEVGDFKIESELTVVDVNMTKLVSDLIDQADISLFDDTEKAG